MPKRHAPRRFLVAVDDEDESLEAVHVAASLARAADGTLTLVATVPLSMPHTTPPGLGAEPALDEPAEQELIDRLAQERLDAAAAQIGDGLDVRTELCWGPEGPGIVDRTETGRHDMLVVPLRRESALGHLVHDHTLRHVLHHSLIPVLVVPCSAPPVTER
jgi:nucleotide-binding universal stress UspA family protein